MSTDPIHLRPKILPWIAHRYVLPLEHAEALWEQAMLMADFRHGRDRLGPEYWGDSVETFLRLAADEGRAPVDPNASEGDGPITALDLLHAQDRVRRRTLSMVERMLRAGTTMWSPRRGRGRKRPDMHH
jgi:hypothetical protein